MAARERTWIERSVAACATHPAARPLTAGRRANAEEIRESLIEGPRWQRRDSHDEQQALEGDEDIETRRHAGLRVARHNRGAP